MHPLDSFARECDKEVRAYETDQNVNSKKSGGHYPFTHRNESNTQALVRVTGKLFHDTKYNSDLELVEYLRSVDAVHQLDRQRSVIYPRFVGNTPHFFPLLWCLISVRRQRG